MSQLFKIPTLIRFNWCSAVEDSEELDLSVTFVVLRIECSVERPTINWKSLVMTNKNRVEKQFR